MKKGYNHKINWLEYAMKYNQTTYYWGTDKRITKYNFKLIKEDLECEEINFGD